VRACTTEADEENESFGKGKKKVTPDLSTAQKLVFGITTERARAPTHPPHTHLRTRSTPRGGKYRDVKEEEEKGTNCLAAWG
jgi:hypothetical protein